MVEVTRSTTLGALSQMRLWSQRSCKSFTRRKVLAIDELGDYSDPETGLEHHLEACATDEEKMAMRVAVFRGLTLIFVLLEKDELHQIILQRARGRARSSPSPVREPPAKTAARAKKSAKPAAKASKKTKKHRVPPLNSTRVRQCLRARGCFTSPGNDAPQAAGSPRTASAPRGARTRGRRRSAQRRPHDGRRRRRLPVHRSRRGRRRYSCTAISPGRARRRRLAPQRVATPSSR